MGEAVGEILPVDVGLPDGWLFGLGAVGAVAPVGLGAGGEALAYGTFVVLGTVGVGAPVVIYLITAVPCLIIGAELVGQAIRGFAA